MKVSKCRTESRDVVSYVIQRYPSEPASQRSQLVRQMNIPRVCRFGAENCNRWPSAALFDDTSTTSEHHQFPILITISFSEIANHQSLLIYLIYHDANLFHVLLGTLPLSHSGRMVVGFDLEPGIIRRRVRSDR